MRVEIKRFINEYYRYIVLGFGVTALDFGLLILQVKVFHVYYLYAACLSYLVANITQYSGCVKYVFCESTRPAGFKWFFTFFLLGLIGLGILYTFMYLFVEKLGWNYLFAKVVVSAFIFTFNFLTRRYVIFR